MGKAASCTSKSGKEGGIRKQVVTAHSWAHLSSISKFALFSNSF